MVAKVHALGRSFAGVAAYCLHDAREPDEAERPETAERVEWADTRNLASRPERAAGQMAATAKAAPELKRLAGGSAAGRKLEKPVLHYTLSWGKDERPDRAEMNRAAEETLKALGLERHQALIVAHRDKDHPHLHMIANRVNPETGKAAKLGNDRLKLANWAERWERDRGGIKCPERVTNREKREAGQYVKDRKSLHTARHRRERMRKAGPVREVGPRVWLHKPAHLEKWATIEREAFRQYQQARGPVLEALARDCRRAWRWQYEKQKADVAAVEKLAGGDVRDRLRLARIAGDGDWRRIRQERDRSRGGEGSAGSCVERGRRPGRWACVPLSAPSGAIRPSSSGWRWRSSSGGTGGRAHGSGSTTPTRRSPPRPRRVMCTARRTWRRTGPPSVCRPWSGRSAKPPGRHRLNGCPIEARAATAAAAGSADFSPDLYPSGARDRPLEAILRPVAFPKCPENGRWASRVREAEFRSPCGWAGPRTPCFAAPRRPMLRLQCGSLPTDLSLREGWPHA